MPRRRLKLRYSSDEDEDDEVGTSGARDSVQSGGFASSVQPETSVASTSNPNPREAIAVSEDVEIIDVSDNWTPTPPDSSIPVDSSGFESESERRNVYNSPIDEVLSRMGIKLKTEWWVSCLSELESSIPQFSGLDVAAKAKHCFGKFLFSDMNLCGGGVLPRNVASMNLVELAGPFVLQVDEIVNISCPLKGRYENANAGLKRCLKLSMTDGIQRIFGMEYRPIKDLGSCWFKGLCFFLMILVVKMIVVSSVQVRRGLMMLVPEVIEVLGGMVEELEEARRRLVVEVTNLQEEKAANSTLSKFLLDFYFCRTRSGGVPPLETRATLAAWSLDDNNTGNHVNSSTSGNATHAQTNGQDITRNARRAQISPRPMDEPCASTNVEVNGSRVEHMQIDTASGHRERAVYDLHLSSINIHRTASTAGTSCSGTRSSSNNVGKDASDQQTSKVTAFVEEMHIDNGRRRDTTPPVYGSGTGAVGDTEVSDMVVDLEIPSLLSTNTERPFTYLAELSQKWAVMKDTMHFVRGRIKCFLTGVKKFQFKQQSTYELLCYVDDGSLICEILLHNDVVQKRIGHSSMEVSAALSSSATTTVHAMMKEKLKRFQLFLSDFEGTMVVEMNISSQYPIAIEMDKGCALTDARLLFERIKSSATTSTGIDSVVILSP